MELLPSLFDGLTRGVSTRKGKRLKYHKGSGREAAEAMAEEAKKNEKLLRTSAESLKLHKYNNFVSFCSKRGQKGINQDRAVVWQEFGCQEDMTFVGVFDGHGSWGHVIAKRVSEAVPPLLLCNWQQALSLDLDLGSDHKLSPFDIWKQSYLKTFSLVDHELRLHRAIDSSSSGATALALVLQGENLVLANAGDSRAVLATISDIDGSLEALQLSVDFKPNLPEEYERIRQARGRVRCSEDEPGLYRLWTPSSDSPGLAVSRAFGDYCVKDFGLISVPDVTHRTITSKDQFLILATDGVWDVISNQEAVEIVALTQERRKSAKALVKCAVREWKKKRRGIAMDDISVICVFLQQAARNTEPSKYDPTYEKLL